MNPLQKYHKLLSSGEIKPDPLQFEIMEKLDGIYSKLTSSSSLSQRLRLSKIKPAKGLYIWGEVGAGKTFMVDLFFNCLPKGMGLRLHFHVFMAMIHQQLIAFKGQKNPIQKIAKSYAQDHKVLCLDECRVADIADAMLLGDLLKALFDEGICLVSTSNRHPEKLYWNGLQRERFIPAIKKIQENTEVISLSNDIDYRMRHNESHGRYFYPLDPAAAESMLRVFKKLAKNDLHHTSLETGVILIQHRDINYLARTKKLLWCNFAALCRPPRCQRDYLEISEKFTHVFISDIPRLTLSKTDAVRNFINLIDVLYDNNVKVVISAAVPIEALYSEGDLEFEFKRTASRLIEMRDAN